MVVQRAASTIHEGISGSLPHTLSSSDQISANISLHASYIHGMTHVEVESSHVTRQVCSTLSRDHAGRNSV
jgi:hypothetical protein